MRVFANVGFLRWAVFLGLVGMATPSTDGGGIVVTVSDEGLQTAAESMLKRMIFKIKGMTLPDVKESFSPTVGYVDCFVTKLEVRECSLEKMTVNIVPNTGVTVSIEGMRMMIGSDLNYSYTLWGLTTWYGGTLSLTISEASVFFEVVVGMNSDGQPTLTILSCYSVVENIDLHIEVYAFSWFINLFSGRMTESIRPTLKSSICGAIKSKLHVIEEELAKNLKPCVDNLCRCRIDLSLTNFPVFGNDSMETKHRGKVYCGNDTESVPFEALSTEPCPLSSKMVGLRITANVFNSAMNAMHKQGFLSYNLTTSGLSDSCSNVLDTSCDSKSHCIGNILPSIFGSFPNASVELDFTTTSSPVLSMSDGSFSVIFNVQADVSITKSDGSIVAVGKLNLNGSVEASAFINPDALMDCNIIGVNITNAAFNDTEIKDSDAIAQLQVVAKECVFPSMILWKQSSLSVTKILKNFHTRNRSLKQTPNAVCFKTDFFYSNDH